MDKESIIKFFEDAYGFKVERLSRPLDWDGYQVYDASFKDRSMYMGLPSFVLVRGDEIRWTSKEEAFAIIEYANPSPEEVPIIV